MTLALKHKKKNKSICAFCGYTLSKRALHIHHIDGNHQNNSEKNLVIVCANCHAEAHEKQKVRNPNMIIIDEIQHQKVSQKMVECQLSPKKIGGACMTGTVLCVSPSAVLEYEQMTGLYGICEILEKRKLIRIVQDIDQEPDARQVRT